MKLCFPFSFWMIHSLDTHAGERSTNEMQRSRNPWQIQEKWIKSRIGKRSARR